MGNQQLKNRVPLGSAVDKKLVGKGRKIMGTLVVGLMVLVMTGAAVRSIYKRKKSGKGCCGCDGSCGGCCGCNGSR